MRLEPVARGALRLADLGILHLGCDLTAKRAASRVAFRRRDIEPLVCADEIDRHLTAARIHHAEFEHRVGGDRRLPMPANVNSGISKRAMT